MVKRKLKGVNAKRIPKHKKDKMKKTLDIMSKNRDEDNRILRDVLNAKLKWAIAEKEKGIKAIEAHNKVIRNLEKQVITLEGIILGFKSVLTPPKKEEENK